MAFDFLVIRSVRVVPFSARVLLAGAAAAASWCAGCASAPGSSAGAVGSAAVVQRVTRVASGQQFVAANALANQHEGDFVLLGSGQSMAPFIPAGSAVVVHPTSYFMLRAGLPVVYRNRLGHDVAHVLVDQRAAGWIVRGLNNAAADPELVTPENLVGVVRRVFCAAETGRALDLPSVAIDASGGRVASLR